MTTRPLPSRHLALVTALTAAVIAASGWVHLRFGPEHMAEATAFGLAFYGMGVAQFTAAAALVARPLSPGVARLAVALNLGLAALWLASRTTGLPFGPEPWQAEPAGTADVLCTVAEVWSAGAVLLVLPRFRASRGVAAAAA